MLENEGSDTITKRNDYFVVPNYGSDTIDY